MAISPRLPVPGSDENVWGDLLNAFLKVSHNSDGTLNDSALNGLEPAMGSGLTVDYLRGDKTWQKLDKSAVGLGNVDNTPDAGKPVSTAVQSALNAKASIASPTFSGTVTVPAPSNATDAATKDYVDTVAAGGAPDATAVTKGKLQLTGDLGGTAASPTVPGLANKVDLTANQTVTGSKIFTGFQDKGGQVYNVKAYGALGDGSTDDSAAVAAALAAANTGNGGVIFFPRGTFKLSSALTLPDAPNVTIVGSGKDVTTLLFNNLTTSCIVKAVPATQRYKYRLSNFSIDNQSRSNAGAIGLDIQRLSNCTFSNMAVTNFETAIRIYDDSFFNLFHDIDVQEAKWGITLTSGPNDRPNENVFYKVKLVKSDSGVGVDYPVLINNGNDNHFTNCSFEDFLTGIEINDIGNSFTNNRIECNRVGSITYIKLDSNAANNSFLNNYYSGSAWVTGSSITDAGAGNSFFEMATYKNQWININRNLITADDLATFTRSGSGDLKAVVTASDTYANSGSPIQFLAKSVRSSGKFISGQLSGAEKFYVDATGQGWFNNGLLMNGSIDNMWSPNLYNMKSWSFDPVSAVNNSTPAAGGTLQLVALRVTKATTITHAYLFCSAIGTGTTNAYAAIYTSGGALLAQSDDQSANMGSAGLKTFTFSSPPSVSSGYIYLAFWATASSIVPTFARGATTSIANALLGTSYRFATADTGLTNTAPATLGAKTSGPAFWAAVD